MAKVLIYGENGARIEDQCQGPNSHGGCRRSQSGAAVVCAGRKIVLHARGEIPKFTLFVDPDARACPLAVLNLYRNDFPVATSPGRAAAALRRVADDLPAITSPGGAAGVLRRVRQRGERAGVWLVDWGRAVRDVFSLVGTTIQPRGGGD